MKGKYIYFRKIKQFFRFAYAVINYFYIYREYYCSAKERISAMKLCFHYLLHVTDSIKNTGPCWATWQFPMERVCGMLLPLAKSRIHPYKNIINNVYLMELINYLSYRYPQIFLLESPKKYANHLTYSNESYLEEFYFPTKNYILSQSQLRKIKENLSTSYDMTGQNLNVCICIYNLNIIIEFLI
jgi:hypothetical protein